MPKNFFCNKKTLSDIESSIELIKKCMLNKGRKYEYQLK